MSRSTDVSRINEVLPDHFRVDSFVLHATSRDVFVQYALYSDDAMVMSANSLGELAMDMLVFFLGRAT